MDRANEIEAVVLLLSVAAALAAYRRVDQPDRCDYTRAALLLAAVMPDYSPPIDVSALVG
jgi:hypothetical protein